MAKPVGRTTRPWRTTRPGAIQIVEVAPAPAAPVGRPGQIEIVVEESLMVLSDAPHTADIRRPLAFVDDPTGVEAVEHVTGLSVKRHLKPGRYTMRDVDHRLPATHRLLATSNLASKALEGALERFHCAPGASLFEGPGGDTPTVDDKLAVRSSELEAEGLVQRRLEVSASLRGHEAAPSTRRCSR